MIIWMLNNKHPCRILSILWTIILLLSLQCILIGMLEIWFCFWVVYNCSYCSIWLINSSYVSSSVHFAWINVSRESKVIFLYPWDLSCSLKYVEVLHSYSLCSFDETALLLLHNVASSSLLLLNYHKKFYIFLWQMKKDDKKKTRATPRVRKKQRDFLPTLRKILVHPTRF